MVVLQVFYQVSHSIFYRPMNTFKYVLFKSQEKVQNTIYLLQYSNLSIVKDVQFRKGSIFNLYAFIIYAYYIFIYNGRLFRNT